jgi:hypothetical protein
MLLIDVVIGAVLALAISPVVGIIAFVVCAGTSLVSTLVLRSRRERLSGSPTSDEGEQQAETADAASTDPSYNPYARED